MNKDFKAVFAKFVAIKDKLKVVDVASCDLKCRPNSAPKMLIDIVEPNEVWFLDYSFTKTYANTKANPVLSLSFMDDVAFEGYRLTGQAKIMASGPEYDAAKKSWKKRLTSYEADRIARRVSGEYSAREAENTLPQDFVIIRIQADEASIVKPDRVLRSIFKETGESES